MKAVEFTIDDMGFASSTLNAAQRKSVDDIARCLVNGSEGVPRLESVQRIVLTGFSSGTKNLEQHANKRAAAVCAALEASLRNFGALPVHLAKIHIGDPVTQFVATAAQSSGKDRKVGIAIFSTIAPPKITPAGLDLVFVTQGDTRPVIDNRDAAFNPTGLHTNTELWHLRAKDLPKVFDGVTVDDHGAYPRALKSDGDLNVQVENVSDVTDAQNVLRRLDRDIPLRNVFFLGHGSGAHGFMFSGRPSGPGPLDAMIADDKTHTLVLSPKDAADDKFMDDNKRFFRDLAGRLATGHAGIWFLACFVGLSDLHKAAATVLSEQGRRNFFVGAYNNFYQVLVTGEIRGTTPVRHTIGGQDFNAIVPEVQRFAHWSDRILDGNNSSRVLIRSSGPNKIPKFEVLDGRGQFILDFLRP